MIARKTPRRTRDEIGQLGSPRNKAARPWLKKKAPKVTVVRRLPTKRKAERAAINEEKVRKAMMYRDAELSTLTMINDQMQQLLSMAKVLDQAIVRLAANVAPMVADLRRDNASLLMLNPELRALAGKNGADPGAWRPSYRTS